MKRWLIGILIAIVGFVILLEEVVSPMVIRSARNHAQQFAVINDIGVPPVEDVGYRVVAVDGKPVQRWSSHFIYVFPYALVPHGRHTLTLEPKENRSSETAEIDVQVEKGKRYRFGVVDESITVVLDLH